MKTIVISAFPGVGKTYFMQNNKDIKILDSDSSEYSHIVNQQGQKVINPEWPKNYMDHLKKQIAKQEWDYILVSSHEVVRTKLARNFIEYYLVYPDEKLKKEYLKRYKDRGSDKNFIKLLNDNFQQWIEDMDLQFYFGITKRLKIKQPNVYLSNIFKKKK